LCYSSSGALPSSRDGMKGKWGEGGRREVSRKEKFWGWKGGWKILGAGEEDVFLAHPQNGLNGLILNWCTGGSWFTPAYKYDCR
jgi:hypothetical protein